MSLRRLCTLLVGGLALIVAAYTVFSYLLIGWGFNELTYDAKVWRELAVTITSGGRPYIDFADNKSPLFVYLVVLGAATDFGLIMTIATAIVSATTVWFTYRWCAEYATVPAGVLAAVLVAGVFVTLSRGINNKVFGLAVLLWTLHA